MKQNEMKGITLIALVITIIVLLILAGVAIATLTGDNGILTKAIQAKDATRGGEVKDYVRIAVAENAMADNTNETRRTRLDVILELEEQGKLTAEELAKLKDEENPVDIITIGGIDIDFSELGALWKTLVEAFKAGEIKVGDYINYVPSNTIASVKVEKQETGVDTSQTYTVDTNMSWRVLGLNENETQLVIITESPIKRDGEDPYLSLKGAESYYYCESTLNKISKIYDNSELASQTRSIKIENINNALGIVREGNVVYKKTDSTKTNLDERNVLEKTRIHESGEYAPKKYIKDVYNLNIEEEKAGESFKATAYVYYSKENIISQNSSLYEILFNGTLQSEGYTKSYWLASPGIYVGPDMTYFGPGRVYNGGASCGNGLLFSGGQYYCIRYAVRPIVELKSDITVKQLTTSNSGMQVDWTGITGVGVVNSGSLTGEAGKIK